MKQVVTTGIVLRRTDYGEADRIIQVLTHNSGKVALFVRGARKPNSKLAGGIELFSVSDMTYVPGKSDLATLISCRLLENFGHIIQDYDRTMYGYTILQVVDAVTEPTADESFFMLLQAGLAGLNHRQLSLAQVQFWFRTRLLTILGALPNVLQDVAGEPLRSEVNYQFDVDSMAFREDAQGMFQANHIKLLRLCATAEQPHVLLRLDVDQAVIEVLRTLMHDVATTQLQREV